MREDIAVAAAKATEAGSDLLVTPIGFGGNAGGEADNEKN
jgi:hypothetical protein